MYLFHQLLIYSINNFDIYQIFEFYNRQAKFVINGQRIYDFFELEWDLPFWSDNFIKFWFAVPAKYKSKQNFYVDFLFMYSSFFNLFSLLFLENYFRIQIFLIPNWIGRLGLIDP